MDLVYTLSLVALLIVCALMILLVLMQKPKQEGLGAAFGGGMTNEMFGAHTVTVLQKGTAGLAVAFFVLLCLTAWSGSALEAEEKGGNEVSLGLDEYQDVANEAGAAALNIEESGAGLVVGGVEQESAELTTQEGENADVEATSTEADAETAAQSAQESPDAPVDEASAAPALEEAAPETEQAAPAAASSLGS